MIPNPIAKPNTILETTLITRLQNILLKDAHSILTILQVHNYICRAFRACITLYLIACKYVINKDYVVRGRGCGGPGVMSKVSFCTNRFKDVLECYCTTDWCNGIDSVNSAEKVAEEHFRRQDEKEESENKNKNAAAKITTTALWLAVIMVLKEICG